MNPGAIIHHKLYRTPFKSDDRVGTRYLVRVKDPRKGAVAEKTRSNVSIYLSKALSFFHNLRKGRCESIDIKRDIAPGLVVEKKLYSMRIFAWNLLKYSKCTKKFTLMSEGLIFNEKSIASTVDAFSKAMERSLVVAQKAILVSRYTVLVMLLFIVALFILMYSYKLKPLSHVTNQIIDYGQVGAVPVIARWQLAPRHNFKNSVYHDRTIILYRSAFSAIMSIYMIIFPAFVLSLFVLIMRFNPIHRDSGDKLKEYSEELQTYRDMLGELAKNKKPLDRISKRILREKGIPERELADYHIYDDKALTEGKITDLFKKIKKYSSRENFRRAIGLELDEICLIDQNVSNLPHSAI